MIVHAVKWTDELSVGVKVLDDDHRKLVALLNKVLAAYYAGVGNATVEAAMEELGVYTREHFTREEDMIAAKGDPNLDEHRRQHRHLEEELERLRAGRPSIEVMNFLYHWLVDHIMGTDMGYRHLFA